MYLLWFYFNDMKYFQEEKKTTTTKEIRIEICNELKDR